MPKNSPEQIIDRPHDAGLRRGGTGTASSGGNGATTFLGLTDTPSSYSGASGAVLSVKSTEDGVEFGAVATTTPTADAIPIAAATGLIANGWLDATLASLAALGTVADRIAYTTATDVWAETTLTAFARTILDDANQAAVQATLALVPGTNVQAYDTTLLSIAALGTAADKMLYTTALDTWAEAAITGYGRTLVALADAAALRANINVENGADVTDATNIASSIHGATLDVTPLDADEVPGLNSGASFALIRWTWTSIKAFLKTYFDTLYNLYVHPNHSGDVTSVADGATTIAADAVTNAKAANMAADTIKGRANGAGTGDPTDLTATQVRTIINVASGADVTGTAITALATKTTPVDADAVVITDSAASDAPKRTTWANIKATLLTYFSTLFAVLAGTAGGQSLSGGTAANEDLTLNGTSHATKTSSYVLLQPNGGFAAIGHSTPTRLLHAQSQTGLNAEMAIDASAAGTGVNASQTVIADGGYAQIAAFGTTAAGTRHGQALADAGEVLSVNLSKLLIGTYDSAPIYFGTNNTLRGQITSGGDWGIGTATPAAKLDILQPTLGSAVQKLASTATNDDPSEIVYQNRVATTDATVTTLHTFTIPASTTVMIEARVVARRTGGSAGAAEDGMIARLTSGYKNVAGTATLLGNIDTAYLGTAGWVIALTPSGGNVLLQVTGAVNVNISWHMTTRTYSVST